jgi:hypothetical protein
MSPNRQPIMSSQTHRSSMTFLILHCGVPLDVDVHAEDLVPALCRQLGAFVDQFAHRFRMAAKARSSPSHHGPKRPRLDVGEPAGAPCNLVYHRGDGLRVTGNASPPASFTSCSISLGSSLGL